MKFVYDDDDDDGGGGDFLLVINSNWNPISYHFEVVTDCYLNFGHFAF